MLYEVKTQSTFTLVYLVEAESEEDAKKLVIDSGGDLDYYQKHDTEDVITVNKIADMATVIDSLDADGYA